MALACLCALWAGASGAAPAAPWEPVEGGWRALASLPSAPYPYGRAPYQDDRVWIFVPEGFSGQALRAVVHIHGYHGRIEALVPAQQLEAQLVASGRDAVLVVPQGPRDAADMALGRLEQPGGLPWLLQDVSALLHEQGWLAPQAPLGPVVLSAHSGGYRGVANILSHEEVPVQAVLLFDALYSHMHAFAQAAGRGVVLRSSWTARGGTARQNQVLLDLLRRGGVQVGDSWEPLRLERDPATVAQVFMPHAVCVDRGWPMASWLESSGLPPRLGSPPRLRAALWRSPTQALVRWQPQGRALRVEGSLDGQRWELLRRADATQSQATVPPRPWLRLVAQEATGDGPASRRWLATGRGWLVVDARAPMRWEDPRRGELPRLLEVLGEVSVVSASLWSAGEVQAEGFGGLLWLEQPAAWQEPLPQEQRRRLESWAASGRPLIWARYGEQEGWAPSQPGGARFWSVPGDLEEARRQLAAQALEQPGEH